MTNNKVKIKRRTKANNLFDNFTVETKKEKTVIHSVTKIILRKI